MYRMIINDCPRSRATGPGLKRVGGGTNLAMSSLSLPPGDLEDLDDGFSHEFDYELKSHCSYDPTLLLRLRGAEESAYVWSKG